MEERLYQKILVAVDGSKNSFKAIRHAAYLASSLKCEIGLLYVAQDIQAFTQTAYSYIPDIIYHNATEFGQRVLAEAQKELPEEITVQTFLEFGSPLDIIPAFAKEQGYSLIVIGRRGLGVLQGLIMGSVSSHVLHHAPCPVLVIK